MFINLDELIKKNNLSDVSEKIMKHTQQSVRLILDNEIKIEKGKSKVGGLPDLSEDVEWPSFRKRPLSFICQINLSEIQSNQLPSHGLLSFFYDLKKQPIGDNLKDKGRLKVLYTSNIESVHSRELPNNLDQKERVDEIGIRFDTDETIPGYNSLEMQSWDLTPIQEKGYYDLIIDVLDQAIVDNSSHRMLGYPDVVQEDMLADLRSLFDDHDQWILLMQLETNDDINLNFCEGMIYFWIKEHDLKNLNFDHVWMIVQFS